jgi:hypothetical protein
VKARHAFALTIVFLLLQGCAAPPGAGRFIPVNADHDLDSATLARYRGELEAVRKAGQRGPVVVLEHANAWPLGLIAYWRRAEVRAMQAPGGDTTYTVSRSRGYGPLSIFYVNGQDVTFNEDGKRRHAMGIDSVVWGHIAMLHSMEQRTDRGHWHRHSSAGFLHHLINVVKEHGRTRLSLFSAPNPVTLGG